MNYFISENAFEFNSGTEFSQAARTSMYNSFGNLTLFVTRNYTPVFHRTIKTLGLNDHQVLNMYDFFQEATRVSRVKQNLRESVTIPKKRYVIESPNPDQSLILNEGRTVAKVNVMPATVALMGNVEYFDRFDHIVARDEWDYRGFKSSTAYFHPNGEVSLQKFYTPVGKVVLEITHMNVQGHLMPTMYKLINYCGANYRFNTENELFTFFMNEQLKQNPGTIILERASMLNTIPGIKSTKGKYFYLHSSHTNLKGQLLTTLVELMRGALDFTGIIVATKQQQQDMQPLTTLPVLAAPDTIVKENKTNLLANCKSHKILVLGRIAKEKQPQDALYILKSVQASVADATLEFRGYSTDRQLLNELDLLIEQLGLKNTVTFGNYVKYINSEAFARTNIEIANFLTTVDTIDANAFANCDNLRQVYFNRNKKPIKNFDYSAFKGCHDVVFYIPHDCYEFADQLQDMIKANGLERCIICLNIDPTI